jgi:hypothetical protein
MNSAERNLVLTVFSNIDGVPWYHGCHGRNPVTGSKRQRTSSETRISDGRDSSMKSIGLKSQYDEKVRRDFRKRLILLGLMPQFVPFFMGQTNTSGDPARRGLVKLISRPISVRKSARQIGDDPRPSSFRRLRRKAYLCHSRGHWCDFRLADDKLVAPQHGAQHRALYGLQYSDRDVSLVPSICRRG